MRVRQEGQARVFRAEEIFDINEFKALASIMGPYGIRVIDYALLKYLNSEMVRHACPLSGRHTLEPRAAPCLPPALAQTHGLASPLVAPPPRGRVRPGAESRCVNSAVLAAAAR